MISQHRDWQKRGQASLFSPYMGVLSALFSVFQKIVVNSHVSLWAQPAGQGERVLTSGDLSIIFDTVSP